MKLPELLSVIYNIKIVNNLQIKLTTQFSLRGCINIYINNYTDIYINNSNKSEIVQIIIHVIML
jgi:hypothetical protein